ncbi:MAG: hypothetical protein GQ559_11610 [Desulfobulbaceae bacterium]|nr:hypothetical protein [Desulfobulbaceae bacterium]
MELAETEQQVAFREVELTCNVVQYVCETCGLETASIKQAGAMQRAIADAYRTKKGLMTGQAIKDRRKGLNMTQKALADAMSVGIASIKRWEGGIYRPLEWTSCCVRHSGLGKGKPLLQETARFLLKGQSLSLWNLTHYISTICSRMVTSCYTVQNLCGMRTWWHTESLVEA